MAIYKATVYTVGSPHKNIVYVEANDYNHAMRLLKTNPVFRRFGSRPKKV